MPRQTMSMSFPPFEGTTRLLVIANVSVFFAMALLDWIAPSLSLTIRQLFLLRPMSVTQGELWQLLTYTFFHGFPGILWAMLTLWFTGSLLEGAFGKRWLRDLYFMSAAGAAVVACLLAYTQVLNLRPGSVGAGAWAPLMAILVAIGMRFGDQEFLMFPLPFSIRAKYLAAIYILVSVALVLKDADTFGALLELSGALAGYLYVRFAPRRGFSFGFSGQYDDLRNAYYRAKRRRAAKKFEVYMGKQGRQVKFDEEGRYIDPDDPNAARRRDPNDKRWMN